MIGETLTAYGSATCARVSRVRRQESVVLAVGQLLMLILIALALLAACLGAAAHRHYARVTTMVPLIELGSDGEAETEYVLLMPVTSEGEGLTSSDSGTEVNP